MTDDGLVFLLSAPILLVSVILHELAHAFAADRLGDPTARMLGRLTLNPIRHLDPLGTAMLAITYAASASITGAGFIFGWARPVPFIPEYFRSRRQGLAIVALAGPLANLAIAVALAAVIVHGSFGGRTHRALEVAFYLNLALALFNLLPIPPLDGSKVVGSLLPDDQAARWESLDRYGILLVLALVLVARGPAANVVNTAMGEAANAVVRVVG